MTKSKAEIEARQAIREKMNDRAWVPIRVLGDLLSEIDRLREQCRKLRAQK